MWYYGAVSAAKRVAPSTWSRDMSVKEKELEAAQSVPTNVDARGPVSDSLKMLAFGVVLLVGMTFGGMSTALIKGRAWQDYANRVERETVQRELRAYAQLRSLPVEDIKVSKTKDGLVVSWRQGNQNCRSMAEPPKNGGALWTAKSVPEGSGGCQTATGSAGIGDN